MRNDLIRASEMHFKAHMEKHRVNIEVIMTNPTTVPGHVDIMDAIEKELEEIANYEDKLEVLNKYFKVG